jgi:hypothetical protein
MRNHALKKRSKNPDDGYFTKDGWF